LDEARGSAQYHFYSSQPFSESASITPDKLH